MHCLMGHHLPLLMWSQHKESSFWAAQLCCSQPEAKGGDEQGGHNAGFKSFSEPKGPGGEARTGWFWQHSPGSTICLAVPGVGPALGGQTLSWAHPCGHAGSPGHLSAAVPTCPVICMTNSNLFYRKPSHWGCQGELWLVWAGACAAPLLSWGSATINTSAGHPLDEPSHSLASCPGITSRSTWQQRVRDSPVPQGGCCQTFPTCLP